MVGADGTCTAALLFMCDVCLVFGGISAAVLAAYKVHLRDVPTRTYIMIEGWRKNELTNGYSMYDMIQY